MTVIISGTDGVSDVDGDASTPALRGTDTNTGIFFGADIIGFSEGGAECARFNADAQFVAAAGTALLPVITTTGDVNTGMFFPAADTIAFAEGGAEAMRITSDGDLLIGTTTQIIGTHNHTLGVSASGIRTPISTKVNATVERFAIDFHNPNGRVGNVLTNGSNTSFNTSSDYRLKENIVPMSGALAKVAQLQPCTWSWKVDGNSGQGFIAHELQGIVPECVTGTKNETSVYTDEDGNEQTVPIYQGVDTSFLVATLTAAIQELSAKNDALEARIAALEAQ